MKYTKRAWFVNKFDVVMCALMGPLLVFMIVFLKLANAQITPQVIGSGFLIGVMVTIGVNFIMALIVTHRAWGWVWLPVYAVVRIFATLIASLCGLLALAMMAYQAQSNEKISKAWTNDNRSRNYREGMKDAATADGFKSAGSGLWGFLVSHTLEFCEKSN